MWGVLNPSERQFQKRKPKGKYKTKVEAVSYTLITAAPNTGKIRQVIKQYESQGWIYAARRESEGFLGFGAHTNLTFWYLLNEPQTNSPAKQRGCIGSLAMAIISLLKFVVIMVVLAGVIVGILSQL